MHEPSHSTTGIRGNGAASRALRRLLLGLFPQSIIITVPSPAPAEASVIVEGP